MQRKQEGGELLINSSKAPWSVLQHPWFANCSNDAYIPFDHIFPKFLTRWGQFCVHKETSYRRCSAANAVISCWIDLGVKSTLLSNLPASGVWTTAKHDFRCHSLHSSCQYKRTRKCSSPFTSRLHVGFWHQSNGRWQEDTSGSSVVQRWTPLVKKKKIIAKMRKTRSRKRDVTQQKHTIMINRITLSEIILLLIFQLVL